MILIYNTLIFSKKFITFKKMYVKTLQENNIVAQDVNIYIEGQKCNKEKGTHYS